MRLRVRLRAVLVFALSLSTGGCTSVGTEPIVGEPPHHVEGGFKNLNPEFSRPSGWTRWTFLATRVWGSFVSPRHFEAPRVANDGRALRDGSAEPTVTWVGHATVLIQLDGLNILTDPHWGHRASPLSWAGPRRLSPPGLAFEDLPKIDVVVISHNHFDHLDLGTVRRLAATHDPLFLVPLAMKSWMVDNGMSRTEELDWWGVRELRGVRFVCVPAQHFSQRALWDRDRRLWASWAVIGKSRRLYFSGDTGYFTHFKEAGDRLGPFDLSAMAIGAYVPASIMHYVHLTPEQAVQASEDLKSRVMLGVHWGTFDLADEPLDEPPRRMLAETSRRGMGGDRAWVFKIGETRRW